MAKKRKNQQQQAMQDVQYQAEIADADDLEAQARSKAADQRVKKRQKKK
ncbi:YfhD family protein [Halalkalibacterium ligniniphilum]|nr:YfhD family protein [Halalkalibacterium ligniniphilum]